MSLLMYRRYLGRLTRVSVFGIVGLVLQDSLAAALLIQRGREGGCSQLAKER
jgi:hypothetical protein